MTATPDLAILPLLALAVAAVWLTLACLTPRLQRRWQRRAAGRWCWPGCRCWAG
ncbi:hypothetical protein [Paracoccus sp. PAMC 22219]|uniref:hypothetical protein n=1 Tax=Paracoccus sp. PAMC 22219 TaxID=1569209 RepID=UPI000A99EFE5|nr:hypothetical protein [Paracoccus sp. PAMC 22219]